jgi:hypothetical protein
MLKIQPGDEKSMSGFKSEFKVLWDTKVKAQVEKCSPEYERLMTLPKNLSEEAAKALAEELTAKYHDPYGQQFIGALVWAVEHALADDRKDLNFLNSFFQIHGVLNNEGFWQAAFGDDLECEEALNYKALKEYMNQLEALL